MTPVTHVFGTPIATAALLLIAALSPASAQTVKITPLGSHAGELCANDRALLFEDPTGVRVLYDASRTIAGAADPRLGAVHVVLLSHAHGDHIGDTKAPGPDAPLGHHTDPDPSAGRVLVGFHHDRRRHAEQPSQRETA